MEDYRKAKETEGTIKDLLFWKMKLQPKKMEKILYALPLPMNELPLKLPEVENYQPSGTGESPLATILEWLDIWFDLETGKAISRKYPKPDGSNWVSATRETNTMPQWAGSCWYHLRYIDPKNSNVLVDKKRNPIGEVQTFT